MVKKRREIKRIIAQFKKRLGELGVEVSQIILYGSYAKGKPREFSDIDIAVVSPTFKKLDIFKRQEILSMAHHGFDEPIEPIGLTPDQIKEKNGLVREILDTGVVLYKK
ncbi:MAG: nucleotidyltransferase domain-containing protein [Deltaproteobacteria bacterium]|jgi:predicted nucleotidyltransferase|nr:nucleotidyltransferase domain-containing protein [Deltaproteobacteria bacterium]